MAIIEWSNELSVGVPEIDEQHKKWVEIYNAMDEKLTKGYSESLKTITTDFLNKMLEYAHYHFQSEEDYMQSIGYPEIDDHKYIHYKFIRQINEHLESAQTGQIVLGTTIIGIIKDWLIDHIMGEDKKYGQFSGAGPDE